MNDLYLVFDSDDQTKISCYTEKEKVDMIDKGIIDEDRFKKVKTVEDLNNCMKSNIDIVRNRIRQPSYVHPRCDVSRIPIITNLVKYCNGTNIIMSPAASDMYISNKIFKFEKFGDLYPSRIDQKLKNNIKHKLKNDSEFTIIIKVVDKVDEISHTFTIFIDIQYSLIEGIFIVDTAQSPYNNSVLANTISIRLDIKLSDEFIISSIFENSDFIKHRMGLQDEEKRLNAGGYCGAWSLYFIYNFIRLHKYDNTSDTDQILEYIYKYLEQNRYRITPIIIFWWDTIKNIDKPSIWENINYMNTVIPSIIEFDEGDEGDFTDMSDDDFNL